MPRLTGGQALVQSLMREGVETLFGLPGVQLDWAYDALYEERDRITVYHTRHEQATAYMADGYARTTGKIGTCMVVPGPGVLNASAALATAYACSSRVLCVAGQIPSATIDKGYGMLHEVHDQRAVMASFTKWMGRADTPTALPGVVREAFRQLRTGRPRPVGIEVPADMLQMTADVTLLDPATVERSAGDPDLLRQAAVLLRTAARPLIYSGGGVLSAGASDTARSPTGTISHRPAFPGCTSCRTPMSCWRWARGSSSPPSRGDCRRAHRSFGLTLIPTRSRATERRPSALSATRKARSPRSATCSTACLTAPRVRPSC